MPGCAGSKHTHRVFLTTRDRNRCQAALGRLRRKQAAASLGSPGAARPLGPVVLGKVPSPCALPGKLGQLQCPPCHEGSQGAKFSFSVGLVVRALLSALNLTSMDRRPGSDTQASQDGASNRVKVGRCHSLLKKVDIPGGVVSKVAIAVDFLGQA